MTSIQKTYMGSFCIFFYSLLLGIMTPLPILSVPFSYILEDGKSPTFSARWSAINLKAPLFGHHRSVSDTDTQIRILSGQPISGQDSYGWSYRLARPLSLNTYKTLQIILDKDANPTQWQVRLHTTHSSTTSHYPITGINTAISFDSTVSTPGHFLLSIDFLKRRPPNRPIHLPIRKLYMIGTLATAIANRNQQPALSTQSKSKVTPTDTIPPVLSTLLVNDKPIVNQDFVTLPLSVQITLSEQNPPDTGIATWNIDLNTSSGTLIQSQSGHFNGDTGPRTASLNITQPLSPGTYFLRIQAKDIAGNHAEQRSPTFNISSVFDIQDMINGPNPFNPRNGPTHIQYQLTQDAEVMVYIYSIGGDLVYKTHIPFGYPNGGSAGFNSIVWDGRDLSYQFVANGMYIGYIHAQSNGKSLTKKIKMMVLK